MLFKIALLIHVAGAIIGIGPSFAFAILGPAAQKAGPNGGLAILKTMVSIDRKLVTPVALFTQPVSGVFMIFATNRHQNFFQHEWLWIAILIFIGILGIVYSINNPALERLIHLIEQGGPPTPEMEAIGKKLATIGPILVVMTVAIIVLMVLKPGG